MMRVCHLNTCPVGVATQDPDAAGALRRHPRARRQLPDARRRGGPRADGLARHPPVRGHDRPRRAARHARRDRPLEGPEGRPLDGADKPRCPPATSPGAARAGRSRCSTTRSTGSSCASARPRSSAASRCKLGPIPVRNVNRTVGGILSGEIAAPLRRRRPARGHDRDRVQRLRRPELRRLAGSAASRSRCAARPTTTPARGCPAGSSPCARPRRRCSAPRRT